MAILPAVHIDYNCIVLERNKQILVKQTPIQLIKNGCLDNLATYEGRKAAVIKRTGFTRKVPIPINPDQHLYTFPTHAADHADCSWIFYQHVSYVNALANDPTQSMIRFSNGETLTLHVSPYILRKQLKRTLDCVALGHRDTPRFVECLAEFD